MTTRTCEAADCDRPHEARGFCTKHYSRFLRNGTTELPTLAERFWSNVDQSADGCWEWQGQRASNRYGIFNFGNKHHQAHRLAFELHNGIAPGDLFVCHRCDNPPCVRPGHLFLGTQKDNLADMVRKGRGSKVRARGEAVGQAVLTERDVREIRRRAASGEQHTSIARDFGVTKNNIGHIVRRRTWKHVA